MERPPPDHRKRMSFRLAKSRALRGCSLDIRLRAHMRGGSIGPTWQSPLPAAPCLSLWERCPRRGRRGPVPISTGFPRQCAHWLGMTWFLAAGCNCMSTEVIVTLAAGARKRPTNLIVGAGLPDGPAENSASMGEFSEDSAGSLEGPSRTPVPTGTPAKENPGARMRPGGWGWGYQPS